ncbi:T9SS type A sorting domain-containing protein, partial [Lishizhenia sp.]|uniref:T9SS type A sorting domain-containing protein n=1 Tax=Lishizhenia sp. TaxID=2497594 RepID=UPI00299DAF35
KDNQALQKSDLDQSWDLIGGLNLGGSVNELTLYPNPAQDMLFVLGVENQSYQVINTLGEQVLKGQFASDAQISLHTLSSGVYFLKIGQSTKRFVISR